MDDEPPPAATIALSFADVPSRCTALLWRHLVHCGGPSIRHAFERLELTTGTQHWTAVGRDSDSRRPVLPRECVRDRLGGSTLMTMRAEALAEVKQCSKRRVQARGWSLEYHVENAGPALAKHLRGLSALAATVGRTVLNVVAMVVVRSPWDWLRSQFSNPQGSLLPSWNKTRWAAGLASHNATAFAIGQGGAAQWTALVTQSGWARPGADDNQTMRAVLSRFDVVGVLERLPEVMLCACEHMRLLRCPVARLKHTDPLPPGARQWPASLGHKALSELVGTTDLRLHELASERLDASSRAVSATNRLLYLGLHGQKGASAAASRPPSPSSTPPSDANPAEPLPYMWVARGSNDCVNGTQDNFTQSLARIGVLPLPLQKVRLLHRCMAVPRELCPLKNSPGDLSPAAQYTATHAALMARRNDSNPRPLPEAGRTIGDQIIIGHQTTSHSRAATRSSTVAFFTMCVGERRAGENTSLGLKMPSKAHKLQMRTFELCVTSMCAFLQHTDTAQYDTYAFVDHKTDPAVRQFYGESGVRMLTAYENAFPKADSMFPHAAPYTYLKLNLWNFTRYESVMWFDADVWFIAPPERLFDKYPLPRTNSLMVVGNKFGWNTGLMLIRPNASMFEMLLSRYKTRVVDQPQENRNLFSKQNPTTSELSTEQAFLQHYDHLFHWVPGHQCENTKWLTLDKCRNYNVTQYHYLPVSVAMTGVMHTWMSGVQHGTCNRRVKVPRWVEDHLASQKYSYLQ